MQDSYIIRLFVVLTLMENKKYMSTQKRSESSVGVPCIHGSILLSSGYVSYFCR